MMRTAIIFLPLLRPCCISESVTLQPICNNVSTVEYIRGAWACIALPTAVATGHPAHMSSLSPGLRVGAASDFHSGKFDTTEAMLHLLQWFQ